MINRFGGKYQFLSNMYPVTIEVRGHKYPSAEHAYQALKCANEDDRIAISVSRSPEEARRAGKCIVRKEGWKDSKIATLKEILLIKFSIPELKKQLLATGDEEIEYHNTMHDTFWGTYKGHGSNILGDLLMKVRKELQ